MKRIVFLGNSHLSAFKFAHDDLGHSLNADVRFFCAMAADLFFTEVIDGRLVPRSTGRMSASHVHCFFGRPDQTAQAYLRDQRPLADVAAQFVTTGGAAEVDLDGVSAIFYVAGLSPYDFVRLPELGAVPSRAACRAVLDRMLGRDYLLSHVIAAVRAARPACKHYLIGRPLPAWGEGNGPAVADTRERRGWVRALADDFLFDAVYRPGEAVLTESLLATRPEFTVGGRPEAEIFQGGSPTRSDHTHMNRSYGRIVFETFVAPLIAAA